MKNSTKYKIVNFVIKLLNLKPTYVSLEQEKFKLQKFRISRTFSKDEYVSLVKYNLVDTTIRHDTVNSFIAEIKDNPNIMLTGKRKEGDMIVFDTMIYYAIKK